MSVSDGETVGSRGAPPRFWLGFCLVLAGVLCHLPDFVMARHHDYMMAGMSMGTTMTLGMGLIVAGVALCANALVPRRAPRNRPEVSRIAERFAALDDAPLTRAHWMLIGALTVGLVVDVMKPASLGFVVPELAAEYGISAHEATLLPFVALVGTVVGSLVWGYLSDVMGRRSAIMLSGVIYVGTSICGFMPSLTWNLVMCFLMGASAGGMLPTVYSLMAESVPARRRGVLLVLQSGLGGALGYLIASGAASVLIPLFSWRSLWLLGAPTGVLLLFLTRWIPESPRFLLANGRIEEADDVMARFGIARAVEPAATGASPGPEPRQPSAIARRGSLRTLLRHRSYRRQTTAIVLFAAGWGVVNWGFITFLPSFLDRSGIHPDGNRWLFVSSLLAIPGTVLAAILYGRWSSRRSMLLYSGSAVVALTLFALLRPDLAESNVLLVSICTLLLASTNGMIAMLAPYAAEVYPTAFRATGSGLAAAASKGGGLLGPVLALTPNAGTLALVGAAPVAAAAVVLWRSGLETSGQPLLELEALPDDVEQPVVESAVAP